MAVIGLDRLRRKLTQTIPAHVEKATAEAMEQGAEEIVAMMKRLVPVDSGALRDSIGWTWGDAPKGAMVLGKSKAAGGDGRKVITIFAGTRDKKLGDLDAFYVRFVEFGTHKMKAEPFFFPSYRALRKRVRGRITRQMRKAIKGGAT
jgi:HK97 gp10 family phage protein